MKNGGGGITSLHLYKHLHTHTHAHTITLPLVKSPTHLSATSGATVGGASHQQVCGPRQPCPEGTESEQSHFEAAMFGGQEGAQGGDVFTVGPGRGGEGGREGEGESESSMATRMIAA